MDEQLRDRLDKKLRLNIRVQEKKERWKFYFASKCCVALKRNGYIYNRSVENDPRNGKYNNKYDEGLFFYRKTGEENMERIRLYVFNGIHGDIRINAFEGLYDDWTLEQMIYND